MVRGCIRMAFVAATLGAGCLSGPAWAQSSDLPCDAFAKNADGLWYATRNADIPGTGENLTIRQGSILRPGAAIRGLDLATMLDRECPAAAAAPQPAVTAPAGAPPAQQQAAQQPRAALSRYADAARSRVFPLVVQRLVFRTGEKARDQHGARPISANQQFRHRSISERRCCRWPAMSSSIAKPIRISGLYKSWISC